jgi:two-component system, chemotaxis family, chemotaxis protein CheY
MVAASALRVMIVDDDEGMRTLMRRTLERMGFSQIYSARDGSEGLELARSQRPDVIVSDYDMPNMHGLQFLKAVREEPALAKTAFVMLSGVANDRVIERAGELGANSIITKPFSAADLKHRLETLVHELTGSRIQWELPKRA